MISFPQNLRLSHEIRMQRLFCNCRNMEIRIDLSIIFSTEIQRAQRSTEIIEILGIIGWLYILYRECVCVKKR